MPYEVREGRGLESLPHGLEPSEVTRENGELRLEEPSNRAVETPLDGHALRDSLEARTERNEGIGRVVEQPLDHHMRTMERVHRRREGVVLEDPDEVDRG